jgi:hypothetical protein
MFVAIGYAGMNRLRAKNYSQVKHCYYELVSYVSSRCPFLTDHPVGDNYLPQRAKLFAKKSDEIEL